MAALVPSSSFQTDRAGYPCFLPNEQFEYKRNSSELKSQVNFVLNKFALASRHSLGVVRISHIVVSSFNCSHRECDSIFHSTPTSLPLAPDAIWHSVVLAARMKLQAAPKKL